MATAQPPATAGAAAAPPPGATPNSVAGVGPTRKTLFRKSGDGEILADGEEKVSQTDRALVEEMLSSLRDAAKEMDRDNWLYESQDPQVAMRIRV